MAAPVAATSTNPGGINFVLPTGFRVSGKITDATNAGVPNIAVGICTDDPGFCGGSVETASDGSFTIHGVQPGTYFALAVEESARNYLNTYYAGATSTTDPGLATSFTVAANVTGINIKLASGLTVSGTVLDDSSQPAANVEVDVSGGSSPGQAITDASGHYTAGGLVPGFYSLFVRPPRTSAYMPGPVAGGTVIEGFDGETFQVAANVSGKDVALVAGNTISGNVSGLVRPATITAFGSAAGYSMSIAANGDFAIPALWPDQLVQLTVQEDDTSGFDEQFPVGVYDGTSTLNIDQSTAVNVDMSGGDITGLNVAAPNTPSLQGHITGTDAVAVHGFVVLCSSNGCASSSIRSAGAFAFWNLPADTYTLKVIAFEHEGGYVTASGVSSNQADADPIVITSSDVVRDVSIPAGFSISGHVSGTAGEPVAGASINAEKTDFSANGAATTDALGNYTIRGLRDGDYLVSAQGPYGSDYIGVFWWNANGNTTDDSQAGAITVPATTTFITGTNPENGSTNVPRTASMSVTFSDSVLGVSGATIWLHELGSTKHIGASIAYDATTHTAVLTPKSGCGAS